MKNLIVTAAVAAFILISQKPAEAATGVKTAVKNSLHVATRSSLRVVKWGVFFPGRWISYAHMALPELCYYAFAGGQVLCDAIIQNDQYDQHREAIDEAHAAKRKQQAADAAKDAAVKQADAAAQANTKAADSVKAAAQTETAPSAEPALKPEIKSEGGE